MPINRRTYTGRVISDKMDGTVVVAVERLRRHKLYGKAIRRKTKLYVDDPVGACKTGDLVRIIETRPLSKTKRFRFQELLWRRAEPVVVDEPEVQAVLGGGPVAEVAEPVAEVVEAPVVEATGSAEPVAQVVDAPVEDATVENPEGESRREES